jgi:putative transcriptional regulator
VIRNNTKKLLDEMGITIQQACDRTGLHRSIMGRLYRNEVTQIDFGTLDAVCKGLDVYSGELIEYIPDETMTPEDVKHLAVRAEYNNKRHRVRE